MRMEIKKYNSNDQKGFVRSFEYWGEEKNKEFFENMLKECQDRKRQIFLGVIDGEIVAYVNLIYGAFYASFKKQGIPEINDLRVLEKSRRNGLATALIEACEEEAKEMGLTRIGLGIGLNPYYDAAKALYLKMGFECDGAGVIKDKKWGDGEYMVKTL